MPVLSLKKAKATSQITDKEIERLAAIFLVVVDQVKVDMKVHDLAAGELGSTAGSTQVLYLKTLKKLRESNCFIGEGDEGDGGDEIVVPATPKKTPTKTKATTKKRKNDSENGGAEKKTSKKAHARKATIEADDEDTITVKTEGGSEANTGSTSE